MIYSIIDIFFVIFHTSLIIFNVLGWTWKKTRLANLITLGLTGGSWFILGIFYGLGYCPLTEWHFNVLEKLGKQNLPLSYTEYLAERLTGANFDGEVVNMITLVGLFFSMIFSLHFHYLHNRDYRKKKKAG